MPSKTPRKAPSSTITTPEGTTLRLLLDRALRTTWRDVKSFSTLASNVKFLNERLGDHLVGAIDDEVIENFVERMYQQGYKPATIKRKLDVLKKALMEAVRWKIIPARPNFPTVTIRNTRDRVVSREEEQKVYEAIAQRRLAEPWRPWSEFEDLVIILLATGGRLGEVLALTRQDVDLGAAYATFQRDTTKSGKPRTVPLTKAAVAAISRQAVECAAGTCPAGQLWKFTEAKAWFFWTIIRSDVGGMADVTLHTLRHTALTRLAQGGMDILRLQKWAGHSDPRITAERYTHLQPSDLVGGIAILEGASI